MKKELAKNFDPSVSEKKIYQFWLDNNFFHAEIDSQKKPYTIMMPPPNVTGVLHMGHALDCTIPDIIIRFKRMQGFNTMWLPGTDHASISTELKVVNKLKSEGIDKEKIGREKFLKYAFDWKNKYGGTIVEQIKRIGCSCDWERLSFTMDEKVSKAVTRVFVNLYKKGLIYKGKKIINWCPKCRTTISDAEVDYEDKQSFLWYLKYPVKNSNTFLEFATTRPETLLGDTAIAVNPNDERYKNLVGQFVTVPFVEREIPIIADEYVDMEYGTGVVKITPAHDPNDFEVGKRHNLLIINIFTDDGFLNENAERFCGLNQKDAREKILDEMKKLGLFVKAEPIVHAVGVHERCRHVVEMLVKPQWFVKMESLTAPAIKVFKSGELKFFPERFGKIYLQWLENLNDWCISRQLWWGHRIPAYYCKKCNHLMVVETAPKVCEKCGANDIFQDDDVLDTWFSSALWPFATLGWPDKTADFNYFYPTNVLVTGYDIIFFWVIRMVFSGLEHTGQLPFKDVLIHGLIRDENGRKMSKSLDNGINPIDVIDKYGSDVLRMTLVLGSSPGNDLRFYWDKIEANRTFINKLWNAAKFILMNDENISVPINFEIEDKWILAKLNSLITNVTANLENYEHGLALDKIYDFIWNEFCDWYIEFSKPRLYNNENKSSALYTLKFVLLNCLKLLHPFLPFVTEELFLTLQDDEQTIMKSEWPKFSDEFNFVQEEKDIELIKSAIKSVRNLRAQMNVHPSRKTKAYISTSNNIFKQCQKDFLLCGINEIIFSEPIDGNNLSVIISDTIIYLPLNELIDINAELKRLNNEKIKLESEIIRASNKLSNNAFVNNAPKNIVDNEKLKLLDYQKTFNKILVQIENLKGGV